MKLEIRSFADAGVLEKERVVLRAIDDVDIGDYVLLRSRVGAEGGPTSGRKDAYWLPDIVISKGDLVVIYSRGGKSAKKALSSGKTAHFYYWYQKKTFWGPNDGNTLTLIEASEWESRTPDSEVTNKGDVPN
jgi:hypothetical protein